MNNAQRTLLKDQAYAELKNRILDGRIAPGSFLAERSLAAELGMSKTPIRAAIGRLESEGFISVAPQQGIVVRELSFHEIVDHFDMRMALETFVVRQVAGRLTSKQLERIQEGLEAQKNIAEAQDVQTYVGLDAGFHLMLAEFLNNQEIIRVMTHQLDKLHRIIFKVLQQEPERMTTSTAEHQAIYQALLEGHRNEAVRHIETHLTYGKRALIAM